jgi:predicted nucleic acid-binding protein
MALVDEPDAGKAVRDFNKGWRDLVRTRLTERLVKHAGELAWIHGLRGHDAVHLASAAAWQQAVGRDITLATFDLQLWQAARKIGLAVFPDDLLEWRATAKMGK